jgi:branched-chain amino acid transport system substrate-binding protein
MMPEIVRRTRPMLLRFTALALSLACAAPAWAELPSTIKIGVLNDQSGPFADQSGKGSVAAAQMAADDFAKEAPGVKVEIVYGDHQNKPDVGSQIARGWVDRDGVAAVADAVNSGVGLAVNDVMRERNRTFIASNVGTSDLTGKFCAPTTVQWTFDTWAFGNSAARALKDLGPFYFMSFDYALGAALERDTTEVLHTLGGSVAGSVKHPLGTTDFSSYLLQAQSSGAKVLAFASTGGDFINAAKQAAEFGVTRTMTLTGLFTQITDVDALGLEAAQGLLLTEAFYWDLNDGTRAFARRFAERMPGRVPTENQAGVYSSVLTYLRVAKAADSIEGVRVIEAMRRTPIEDPLFGTVTVRQDGRAVHAMHVFRVKAPAASKSRWDVYELVSTIPAAQAFRPLDQGGCPLVAR